MGQYRFQETSPKVWAIHKTVGLTGCVQYSRMTITLSTISSNAQKITIVIHVALNDRRDSPGAMMIEAGRVITAYIIGNVIAVLMTNSLSQ